MTRVQRAALAVAIHCAAGAAAVAALSCGAEQRSGGGAAADGAVEASASSPDSTEGASDSGGTFAPDVGFGSPPTDASPDQGEACTPTTTCPPGITCGRFVDPCSGAVFVCGSPCGSGQVCVGTAARAQSCQPMTCAGRCGVVGVDSCGVPMGCGGCTSGEDCIANQCVPRTATVIDAGMGDGCAPLTCAPSAQTRLCGTVHDACGNSMQCSCPAGLSCMSGLCSPVPPECDVDGAAKCGAVRNACGSGNVTCGGCAGSTQCVNGACTACNPPSCGAAKCGTASNGCGASMSCGTCAQSEVCENGSCCTPMTCTQAVEGGLASGCGVVDLGCGVKKSCAPCSTGEVCVKSACEVCTPKTCADFGGAGCGHSDGCGRTLDCCGAGTTCQGGTICCAPGEVDYNGSCCLPGCDLDQPAGPQNSCGQVILCAGTGGGGSSGGSGASSGGTF